jgi:hypothetical protein
VGGPLVAVPKPELRQIVRVQMVLIDSASDHKFEGASVSAAEEEVMGLYLWSCRRRRTVMRTTAVVIEATKVMIA